jgi:hypothetical protein
MDNVLFCVNGEIFATAQQIADNVIEYERSSKRSRLSYKQKILAFRRKVLKEGKHFNFLLPSDLPKNGKITHESHSDVICLGHTGVNSFSILGIREVVRKLFRFTSSQVSEFIAKYFAKPLSNKALRKVKNKNTFKYVFLKNQKKPFFCIF